jgi:hypothetical protein
VSENASILEAEAKTYALLGQTFKFLATYLATQGLFQAILSIKCNPLCDDIIGLISPTLSLNAASSNSGCISPLPK